jgi:hypothetical protein
MKPIDRVTFLQSVEEGQDGEKSPGTRHKAFARLETRQPRQSLRRQVLEPAAEPPRYCRAVRQQALAPHQPLT